jgi:adenylate kinase
MRMIFLGPPGAGKGTQTSRLASASAVPHISTGDMLRAAVQEDSPLGKMAQQYMQRGKLVPDDVMIDLVLDRIEQPDCANGFLLDGFPRTRPQAEALDAALQDRGMAIDAVILLEVPDELILQRITGRRQDPATGAIYHLKFNPPPPEIVGRLTVRADDTDEAVRSRLATYHATLAPVVAYYAAQGLLRRVNGVGEPDAVTARLLAVLGKPAA